MVMNILENYDIVIVQYKVQYGMHVYQYNERGMNSNPPAITCMSTSASAFDKMTPVAQICHI